MKPIQPAIEQDRAGIQVIARAAAVLRALHGAGGLSLGEIATRVELPRSTVQRIVDALKAERFVASTGGAGGLRLGPGLRMLADSARPDIAEFARPVLSALSRETGETVDLAVLRGDHLVFIDQIPGIHRLRAISFVGETFPLTTTANGKACLARLDEEAAYRAIRQERPGPLDAIAWNRLLAELDATRATGLAFDLDEHTPGISAAGASFLDGDGVLHAVSVPVPSARFASVRPTIERSLIEAVGRIEARLAA